MRVRTGTTAVLAGLLLTLAACAGPDGAPESPTSPIDSRATPTTPETPTDPLDAYAHDLVAGTNAARTAEDVPELDTHPCARAAALDRAAALVGSDGLTHAPLQDVTVECGFARSGENLSRGDAEPQEIVDAWLDSPGHRNNLLSADFTHVGIGCVDDGGQTLCSQVFLGEE